MFCLRYVGQIQILERRHGHGSCWWTFGRGSWTHCLGTVHGRCLGTKMNAMKTCGDQDFPSNEIFIYMQVGLKPPLALAKVQHDYCKKFIYQVTRHKCQMALCLIFMRHALFDLHQICVARVSWPTFAPCIVRPLRMLSTKELDINPCCSSSTIKSWSAWILIFLLRIYFKKTFEKLQHLRLCQPTYFQQKRGIRSYKSPGHILMQCLGSFTAVQLPLPIPRLKTTRDQKCYVQRPWWLWEKNESCDRVVGVSTDTGKFGFWFIRRFGSNDFSDIYLLLMDQTIVTRHHDSQHFETCSKEEKHIQGAFV